MLIEEETVIEAFEAVSHLVVELDPSNGFW
jgi:hypothetical protein